MRTYNEQVERDIRTVFDNHGAANRKIMSAATFYANDDRLDAYEKREELADFISDMYYERVNAAADLIEAKHPQTVNNHISAMLIRERHKGLPTDIFRELAIHYMGCYVEHMGYMRSSLSEA